MYKLLFLWVTQSKQKGSPSVLHLASPPISSRPASLHLSAPAVPHPGLLGSEWETMCHLICMCVK